VYHSDSAVHVTTSEATFGNIRVPIAEIESAKMVALPPKRNYLLNIGLVLLVLGCLFSTTMRWFPASGDFGMSYVLLDLSRVLIWVAAIVSLLWWLRDTRFLVKIRGDFGEKTVVVARRIGYARQIVSAVNRAVKEAAPAAGQVREKARG
jgi:hypothetical protein